MPASHTLSALLGLGLLFGSPLSPAADAPQSANRSAAAAPATAGAVVAPAAAAAARVSQAEASEALKLAMAKAVERTVARLGAEDGYLQDPQVRIPLPPRLAHAEPMLLRFGQQGALQRFTISINRAAAQSVRDAQGLLLSSAQALQFQDSLWILYGPMDAATRHLRAQAGVELRQQLLPIVQAAVREHAVDEHYAALVEEASAASPAFSGMFAASMQGLDGYLTDRTLDGLFAMLAEQEARIRLDPSSWDHDSLKRGFGSRFPG